MARRLESQPVPDDTLSLVGHLPLGGPLPHPLTSLVGRTAAIADLTSMLAGDDHRLVTIVGPGGIGKTRLAIAVGTAIGQHSPLPVSFIPLAAVTEPGLLPFTVASVLGVIVQSGQTPEQALVAALAHRRQVLVLDNFEHLLDAAPVVSSLLQRCPQLRVLVTSRSVLRVNGETIVRLAPLPVPESPDLHLDLTDDASASRLFVERATALDLRFEMTSRNAGTIAAICREVDGLPLAIELAVGLLPIMSPETMLERLVMHDRRLSILTDGQRDAPDRHRTMERAIRWSYDLLSPGGQRLFRTVAAFTGGCTWDALETVATANGIAPDDVTGLLIELVEQSLVDRQDDPGGVGTRYTMLETIREFGLAELAQANEAEAVWNAHAGWCERFAVANEYAIHTGLVRHRLTMDQARAEIPNIRSALHWTISRHEADRALIISGASAFAWSLIHMWGEGISWIERALGLPAAPNADPNVRLRAGSALARLLVMVNQPDRARDAMTCADALVPFASDPLTLAYATWMRGIVRAYSGDAMGGSIDCEAASRDFMAWGEPGLSLAAEFSAARAAATPCPDDHSATRDRLERILAALPPNGHDFLKSMTLSVLAGLDIASGNLTQARIWLRDVTPILIDMDELWILALHIENLARLEADDHPEWSLALLQAAGVWRAAANFPVAIDDRPIYRQIMERLDAKLGPAASEAARARGASMSMAEAIACALDPPWRLPITAVSGRAITSRESEVLHLVVEGASDKEIAATLGISRRTASRHVAAILDKFDVGSRTAAATLAMRLGLLDPPNELVRDPWHHEDPEQAPVLPYG